MDEFFMAPPGAGRAHGFAVFLGPDGPPVDAGGVMGGMWRTWMPEADQVRLDEDGLAYVEARTATWTAKPRYAGKAVTGAALFLGDLLVGRIETACWRLQPNGYPFVSLGPGSDLDVLAAGRARRESAEPSFTDLYRLAVKRAGGFPAAG
jgi:hypothetical protein